MSRLAVSDLHRTSSTAHGRVVDRLGEAIVTERFPAGTLLPRDEELLEEFGVSRTVLREALKTLAAKGMISARARVGTMVRPRRDWNMFDGQVLRWHLDGPETQTLYRQIFEMRLAFEPFAAALAAGKADADLLAEMRTALDEMEAADDAAGFSQADLKLHFAIMDATGNAFYRSVGALIEAALGVALRLSSPADDRATQIASVRSHAAIVDAIEAGDAEAAAQAMTVVIDDGRRRILG